MKTRIIIRFFLIIFACSFFAKHDVKSQITATAGQTAQWYVENVLSGGGIQISNVTYSGHADAIGMFQTGAIPTNLGLSEGIILSTGLVNGNPAIGDTASNNASTSNSMPGDAMLTAIAGSTTYDAAILSFNFVPLSDTVKFRYVFASEEYHQFVNSSFNDVFAFFISGTNPLGGNYNNYNIARLPGTSYPASINTVNNGNSPNPCSSGPCTNCAYFVDNCNGTSIVFDGFTVVLTAWALVVPCQTYHLKIAIADAGDGIMDSGVFLEAGSLQSSGNSGTLPVTASSNSPVCSGDTLFLFASGGSSYYWSGPNGFSSTEQNPFIDVASAFHSGSYLVTVNDSLDCNTAFVDVTVLSNDSIPPVCFVEYDTTTSKNRIHWGIHIPWYSDSVKIYRETALDVWTEIGTAAYNAPGFIDITSQPHAQAYSYKISVIDVCETESALSLIPHTTINLLSTYNQGTHTYGFSWSPYLGQTVSQYFLYGVDASNNYSLIAAVPGNITMYNYLNPDPAYVSYFVGFFAPDCYSKSNVLVKSNFVHPTNASLPEADISDLQIYPNPAQTTVNISFYLQKPEPVSAYLYDLTGRKLRTFDSKLMTAGEQHIVFETQHLSRGLYFIRLQTGDGFVSRIIMITGEE
jgi:hypothetical protein